MCKYACFNIMENIKIPNPTECHTFQKFAFQESQLHPSHNQTSFANGNLTEVKQLLVYHYTLMVSYRDPFL